LNDTRPLGNHNSAAGRELSLLCGALQSQIAVVSFELTESVTIADHTPEDTMDLGLREKSAVVLGGSKGIGRSIALRFAEEGANVAICARGHLALQATESELRQKKVQVCARVCDVGKPDALRAFLETARRELGSVEVLVNNATAFAFSDDEEGWQASLNVDLMGAVRASNIVTPWMTAGGGGAIVHISSLSGMEAGSPPAYAAAKAALISHSKNLARTLAPNGVRVNAVAPGSIEFPNGLWDGIKRTNRPLYDSALATSPWGRMGAPDEVADAVVFLASPRAAWITGVCLVVDGGQHKGNL
jgi:3-oxoacyl-[acyl-carrier protein] reductase